MGVSAQAPGNLLHELCSLLLALPGAGKSPTGAFSVRPPTPFLYNSKKKTTRERWFSFWSW